MNFMKVYKIQFEAIDNDCWGRTENYAWKDYDSNLYACKELAKEALKNISISQHLHGFRIKEVEVIDYERK